MLQIKEISKKYQTGELVQVALDEVSLNFRDNEFVAILGPSGSGKTTLLNIVGGLDRYDNGDLIINDVSTKDYKDADWDSYRNHTIGFVFQSYNLIPHQTVLSNVELALTIGGITPKERKERAMEALEQVGLADQAHKKPNQMSGGQMQRVAIARALVNNPDILLADEPTGALDTETSVQVMDLLKEVARDRLVIMVTHNPELAETYATRIVNLRDGRIIGDSDPFVPAEEELAPAEHRNLGKASMSFKTALSLSLNNLMTKKARTILTAFAGSIGIIGIALILSLSTGFHNYINQIQEETLTSYPLTITADTADMTTALLSMVPAEGEGEGEKDIVKEMQVMSSMFGSVGKNDLKSFKHYMEENQETVDKDVSLIQYQYAASPMIFTEDCNDKIAKLNPNQILNTMSGYSMDSISLSMTSVFHELVDDQKMLDEQYDVLAGRWPEAKDEAVIILQDPHTIPDLLVYSLGLRDPGELKTMITKLMAGEKVEHKKNPMKFTYEELMDIQLKVVDATETYRYNGDFNLYEDMSENQNFMEDVYKDGMPLKITGVMCMKDGSSSMNSMVGVCYTQALTKHVIDVAKDSPIVKKQMKDKEFNVFTGKRFDDESEDIGMDFQDLISVDEAALESAFGGNVSEETMKTLTEGYMTEISKALTTDTSKAQNDFNAALTTMATDMMNDYIDANYQDAMQCAVMKMSDIEPTVNAYMETKDCKKLLAQLEKDYLVPQATFADIYKQMLTGMLQGYIAAAPLNPGEADLSAAMTKDLVVQLVPQLAGQDQIKQASAPLAAGMTEAVMQKNVLTKVGELTAEVTKTMAEAFQVDPDALAAAFQFDMTEEEIAGIMEAMTASGADATADMNLNSLGYQDLEKPTMISIYFKDFDSKERFIDFLDAYNDDMEKEDEDKVISYTDITGLLMSSVSTIVDSVTYVLIAFVSISLIVSSIMIGIITYISVLERTKEIGILRAIGASKRNISSIFNAETFIVGLFAGVLGIIVTLILNFPINYVIHTVTGNPDITAVLPAAGGVILIILSVVLTLISGLIPSKQAAKKDPVLALRSE
ncbi:MAG: ABC transporter ATP-binding protein/permease [Firmicutes bacterium]|nr:ABC transporter ATP-binding protein/permease [Bacillota bacterium]